MLEEVRLAIVIAVIEIDFHRTIQPKEWPLWLLNGPVLETTAGRRIGEPINRGPP